MSWENTNNIIRSYFGTTVEDVKGYPCYYDNQEVPEKPTEMTPWMRINIVPGDANQVSLGSENNRVFRHVGLLIVQCFTQLGKGGDKPAISLADFVGNAFRARTLSSLVVFMTPRIVRVGRTDDGWYQVNASCPFYYDDIA